MALTPSFSAAFLCSLVHYIPIDKRTKEGLMP